MDSLDQLKIQASTCVKCSLSQTRTNSVFSRGNPKARIMFIGEAPGKNEDLEGKPFVGRSGQLLDKLIKQEMIMEPEQCYVANVVKCRPPDNRDPKPEEVQSCFGYLEGQLNWVQPSVIVTLGNWASRTLLETNQGITQIRGKLYPFGSSILIPTYHPAAALRGRGEVLAQMRSDFAKAKQVMEANG